MGAAKYIAKNERNVYLNEKRRREILMELVKAPMIYRVDHPTRLFKARALGYKAKQGYFIVRIRISKGLTRRERPNHARHPSKAGIYFGYALSAKEIAKHRIQRKYPNADILGIYYLVENGNYKWFEAVLKDKSVE